MAAMPANANDTLNRAAYTLVIVVGVNAFVASRGLAPAASTPFQRPPPASSWYQPGMSTCPGRLEPVGNAFSSESESVVQADLQQRLDKHPPTMPITVTRSCALGSLFARRTLGLSRESLLPNPRKSPTISRLV